ncbi:MAG: hypothetical protein JRF47_18265 [Deltaproteobacteria bacterium]|nr:hypothetical protein [Deltaproteobacteria bacterium]
MDSNLALQLTIQGVLLGGIYGLIALGLSLIFGVMGVINFAHGQIMVMAMYVSYWIFVLLGIDPYLSLVIVAAVIFVLGYLIQATVVNRILDYPEAGLPRGHAGASAGVDGPGSRKSRSPALGAGLPQPPDGPGT